MPTVIRKDGFEIRIRTNDHEPAHVHAIKADGQAKIQILDDVFPVEVHDMKNKDVRKACELVFENQEKLLREWKRIINGQNVRR